MGEGRRPLAGLRDPFNRLSGEISIDSLAAQQTGMALNHCQQIIEFVRNAGRQASNGLHLLRSSQGVLNPLALKDLMLELLRPLHDHAIEIFHPQFCLASKQPFSSQRMSHLEHFDRIKRFLQYQQAVSRS